LAYGRDLQAEEILKEALRTSPERVAIHAKLLEIYSKRRDAKAFEQVATEAYSLTQGEGPEWEHICEMGQELDSGNPLYRPGGAPSNGAGHFGSGAVATQPMPIAAAATAASPSASDLDLDLDFSLGDEDDSAPASLPAPLASAAAPAPYHEPTISFPAAAQPAAAAMDMDFGSATVALDHAPPVPISLEATQPVRLDAPGLNLPENSLSFDVDTLGGSAASPAAKPAAAAPESGMIEFDLGALSLDLGTPVSATEPDTADAPLSTAGSPLTTGGAPLSAVPEGDADDPLATKLALAEEFNAIGDPDGARSLAEEVRAEASGELKSRAERFLAEIG